MWLRRLPVPVVAALLLLVAVLAGFALYWFQPWKLVTDSVVDEALPTVSTPPPSASTAAPSDSSAPTGGPAPAVLLATGSFVSHEHRTTGAVEVVRLGDGRRQLLVRGLDTSNGPDLRIWLSDQPVIEGTRGWRVFDDGKWVELGALKGNRGDQAYEIPSTLDLADYRSVSVWCRRFAVSFGAASLNAARS